MYNYFKKNTSQEIKLYNKILTLSRNKFFFEKLGLEDTFQNRINLIFLHISFLFIKTKQKKNAIAYKQFYQEMFDLIFEKIELNMREIGFGDTTINKNMKFLVKTFYIILLNCEKYKNKSYKQKNFFFDKHLNINIKNTINKGLIDYFDKYHTFCLDLSSDYVLKGELNFINK